MEDKETQRGKGRWRIKRHRERKRDGGYRDIEREREMENEETQREKGRLQDKRA